MSRQSELPPGPQKNSKEKLFVESLFNRFSRSINNDGADFQDVYHPTSISENRSYSQRYFAENRLQDINSTIHGLHGANHIRLPDWPVALRRWGIFWDLHIYGFSVLYVILIIISVVLFLRYRFRIHRFRIVFNTLILLAASGVFRAVFMLVDPYGYKGRMTGLFIGIMTQAVYPLFCASYGLTQVMLVRLTNADVGHSKIRTLTCILACTLSYLFLVVIIETLVFYQQSLKLLLLIDSACFIVWSLCLGVTFICSGFRLSQHMTENNKELHDSNNLRSPENNLTSSITNETNITIFSVDLNSSVQDPNTVTSANSDTFDPQNSQAAMPFASHNSLMLLTEQYDPCTVLSRQRPEMIKRSPVIIALAENDDDKSTSSTDIERPPKENSIRKRTKRRMKHRKSLVKTRREAKSTVLISKYRAVSALEETSRSKDPSPDSRKSCRINHDNQNINSQAHSVNFTSLLLNKQPPNDTYNMIDKQSDSSSSHALLRKPLQRATDTTASELPLLSSTYLHPEKTGSSYKTSENVYTGEHCEDNTNADTCKCISPVTVCECNTSLPCSSEGNKHPSYFSEADIHLLPNQDINIIDRMSHLTNDDHQARETSTGFNHCLTLTDADQTKENGYLADSENVISTHSSVSRPSLLKHQKLSRESSDHDDRDCSFQRSSGSYSDEDSITSTSDRRRSSASIYLKPVPGKQSKLIQAAIYLTYVLTLLFMFACLLQLYTAFGVYGVLGTIPRPDPWPWLIFQSIFRFTEISIGLVIASISLIALQYRHKRYKRRHQSRQQLEQQQQQEQHLECTGDCTV